MASKPNKTVIGVFIIGAIALAFAVVLIFGGSKLFTRQLVFITYFDGSVKGLSEGSPVMFRGVQVGSVTDISITVIPAGASLKIPVTFTLEPDKFEGAEIVKEKDPEAIRKAIVDYGMHTQLQTMSFLTGQLMVSLEFDSGRELNFVGIDGEYPEIPSVPTPLEELQKTLENLPFRDMIENLNSTLARVDKLVRALEKRESLSNVDAAIQDIQVLVRHIDEGIGPLMQSLTHMASTAEGTLSEASATLTAARRSIEELESSARETLDSAQAALSQSEQTVQTFSADSRLVTQVNSTMQELSAAARSLRRLSDYLERHPESLLRGKAGN